jgi:uncharacterized protein YndB with AHSA1/START domain
MKTTDEPVVIEQSFDASSDSVWNALTQIDQMRQWFFDNIPAFEPEVGFETQFNVQSESRNFQHMWKVTEVVPRKMLTYDWQYEEYPGHASVVYELFEENNTTKLRLTLQVREDFPEDIPEFKRESCIAGWKYFLGGNLKAFLEQERE